MLLLSCTLSYHHGTYIPIVHQQQGLYDLSPGRIRRQSGVVMLFHVLLCILRFIAHVPLWMGAAWASTAYNNMRKHKDVVALAPGSHTLASIGIPGILVSPLSLRGAPFDGIDCGSGELSNSKNGGLAN